MPPQPQEPKASNMKSFKALNRQIVQEGRPSQRHPLEGHEYHKKSDEALIHIAKDAHAAAEAMKSHNTTAENKYRDQASDSATVRYFRKKNGMPEWYKKKYGHVKEGVVEEGENNQVKDGDPCWKGYQMVGMKNKGGKKVPNCVQTKEEVEQIEELSKNTLLSYVTKVSADSQKNKMDPTKRNPEKANRSVSGVAKAHNKFFAKEQAEPITELSSETLDSYKEKAKKSSDSLTSQGKYRQANDRTMNVMKATGKQMDKTVANIRKALNRESVVNEVMDEPNYSSSIQARQKKAEAAKTGDANMPSNIGTPAQSSLKQTPKKLETPVYESRQLQIVREAMADAKKKDAAKKNEKKVSPAGNDKFQSEPELTSSITKNA